MDGEAVAARVKQVKVQFIIPLIIIHPSLIISIIIIIHHVGTAGALRSSA